MQPLAPSPSLFLPAGQQAPQRLPQLMAEVDEGRPPPPQAAELAAPVVVAPASQRPVAGAATAAGASGSGKRPAPAPSPGPPAKQPRGAPSSAAAAATAAAPPTPAPGQSWPQNKLFHSSGEQAGSAALRMGGMHPDAVTDATLLDAARCLKTRLPEVGVGVLSTAALRRCLELGGQAPSKHAKRAKLQFDLTMHMMR